MSTNKQSLHSATASPFNFSVPSDLLSPLPTEERGIARDQVRLLLSRSGHPQNQHLVFSELDRVLNPGDVLVINRSATVAAAYPINLPNGSGPGRLHLMPAPAGQFLVEIRQLKNDQTVRFDHYDWQGSVVSLDPKGKHSPLLIGEPYEKGPLWWAEVMDPEKGLPPTNLPVQYDNLSAAYPLDYYQPIFGTIPGSVEMPSAGRGFTQALIARLQRRGIIFAELILHTGISSPEINEGPLPEYFSVGQDTVNTLENARRAGRRIIGVGTTAIRATESAVGPNGQLRVTRGWTNVHLSPETPLRVCNGLITGFHEPRASHLDLLSALIPARELDAWYREAIREKYFWHEFGDLHLMLKH